MKLSLKGMWQVQKVAELKAASLRLCAQPPSWPTLALLFYHKYLPISYAIEEYQFFTDLDLEF